jgi:malonyl-CoA decarboxylase
MQTHQRKGLTQSNGIMVNYLYDLDVVEKNHELFFKNKEVILSSEMKSLKKKYS